MTWPMKKEKLLWDHLMSLENYKDLLKTYYKLWFWMDGNLNWLSLELMDSQLQLKQEMYYFLLLKHVSLFVSHQPKIKKMQRTMSLKDLLKILLTRLRLQWAMWELQVDLMPLNSQQFWKPLFKKQVKLITENANSRLLKVLQSPSWVSWEIHGPRLNLLLQVCWVLLPMLMDQTSSFTFHL